MGAFMPNRRTLVILLFGAASLALFAVNPRLALSLLLGVALGISLSLLWRDERTAGPTKASPGTEERRDEADRMASALFDATMQSLREGVVVVDRERRIVAANRAALDLFRANGRDPAGKRLSELTRNPEIHEAFRLALEEAARAEVKVETYGGERRVFDLRVAPLQRPEGAREALGVFFDITRLERLERVRQEFLSNVSHELRTPLTSILAFVETLEEGAIDDPLNNRRFLGVIRKNAERMRNLIDDILELSAIESGNVRVEISTVNLRSIVQEVFAALARQAALRDIELRNEVSEQAMVRADARRLEQMLTNLVDNAIKFNRDGGRVTVRHERCADHDRIMVEDTGEGIAPEHLSRIFERFYRVDRARSREQGGTGLGLAIVKHLARAHGGEASASSIPGQGSTFIIELPIGSEARNAERDDSRADVLFKPIARGT
ncbi:PAS domain S-box [Pyrinomonas methylaliphatogenes]|uniref:histidine kinase n=2 Tax=Pyrinomonas methylaliphatogenes TaxID=454194 RepID=A0A0B6X176_9BACT|nr:PAS domain S-box [Pyrinomonas methylaliphatogenes]